MRSHTRQNSRISVGVPIETRMYLSKSGMRPATRTRCFAKWSTTCADCWPVLSMTKFVNESIERSIRASLQRASADLNRVDYRALNADARTQYDTAKRWVRQADEAIRAKNLVFAKSIAEKAATIAAQLAGR